MAQDRTRTGSPPAYPLGVTGQPCPRGGVRDVIEMPD
jgi:hypothetical protein